jgi:hypothetical protein
MKKIILILALLLGFKAFSQPVTGGVMVVGGVAVFKQDTSAERVTNTIINEGTALSLNQIFYTNYIIWNLKQTNVWSATKALYGIVGGTAASHKWNWKDMRDLDAAFRLSNINNIHLINSSLGIKFAGNTSQGVRTFINHSLHLLPQNYAVVTYTNFTTTLGSQQETGIFQSGVINLGNAIKVTPTLALSGQGRDRYFSTTKSTGVIISSRLSTTNAFSLFDGHIFNFDNTSFTSPNLNAEFLLGGQRGSGTGLATLGNPTQNRISYAAFSDGVTETQAIQSSHIITFAQGILNRQ